MPIAAAFVPHGSTNTEPRSLMNGRSGVTIATSIELALDRRSRRVGLLGRAALAPGSALVLAPCWAVHTCFMQFTIDVVFVRRDGSVLKHYPELRPWRAAAAVAAWATIELAAGTIAAADVRLHDHLLLLPRAR